MTIETNSDGLTPQQALFVEALFDPEIKGDKRKAMTVAGYSLTTKPHKILSDKVVKAILERSKSEIISIAPKAALELEGVLDNPQAIGSRERLSAIKETLDRAGISKVEQTKVEVEHKNAVFVLPSKETDE